MKLFYMVVLAILCGTGLAKEAGPSFGGSWFDPQVRNSNRPASNFGFLAEGAVSAEIIWHDGSPAETISPAVTTAEGQQVFRTTHLFSKKGTYRVKVTLWSSGGKKLIKTIVVRYDGS